MHSVKYNENLKLGFFSDSSQVAIGPEKVAIGPEKVAIGPEKVAIGPENPAIEIAINNIDANKNTKNKAVALFKAYGNKGVFGRRDIILLTGDSQTAAGNLVRKLKASGLIEEVRGQGKGKYRFVLR